MAKVSWVASGNDTQRLTAQLRGAISQLAASAATLQALTNVMSQMVAQADFTTIESSFGLAPGDGQTLHDVVGTASVDLQGGNIQGLLQRFG
jgi:hypothetical protein